MKLKKDKVKKKDKVFDEWIHPVAKYLTMVRLSSQMSLKNFMTILELLTTEFCTFKWFLDITVHLVSLITIFSFHKVLQCFI